MAIKKNTRYLIGTGTVLVLIIGAILFNGWKERQFLKEHAEKVEAEIRYKDAVIEAAKLIKKKDSLESVIVRKQKLIDELENNPTVIIKNNDKSHLTIDRLNAYNSAYLFSNNIARYKGNRERYSLHRFDK
jgi:hypothetical protein